MRQYAEPPFRVGRCFPDGPDGVHLVLASSAPGIFGGDAFRQSIIVERGARVRLTSQSALQVHASRAGAVAEVTTTYQVDAGAHLDCQWDPMIPFRGACIDQRIDINLSGDASLWWSDALMNGRAFSNLPAPAAESHAGPSGPNWACKVEGTDSAEGPGPGCGAGERWLFRSLAHELRVSRDGVPEYLERYRIEPEVARVDRRWAGADACYFGTTVVSGTRVAIDEGARLHALLSRIPGVRGAADVLDRHLLVARLMAVSGPAFHAARALIRDAAFGQKR